MTDAALPSSSPARPIAEAVRARVAARYRTERMFQALGIGAIVIAIGAVVLLLGSVIGQSAPALTEHRVKLGLNVTQALADPVGRGDPRDIRLQGDFYGMVQESLARTFPAAEPSGFGEELFSLVESVAAVPLAREVAANPALIGGTMQAVLPINDDIDLYFKGLLARDKIIQPTGAIDLREGPGGIWTMDSREAVFAPAMADLAKVAAGQVTELTGQIAEQRALLARAESERAGAAGSEEAAAEVERRIVEARGRILSLEGALADARSLADPKAMEAVLTANTASFLVETHAGVIKLDRILPNAAIGRAVIPPRKASDIPADEWRIREIATPENARPINDAQIAFANELKARGLVESGLNLTILARSDSNEPELAGLAAAIVGSLLTLVVVLVLAVPIGVLTAVYLEEFAPKNRWTDLIEVNINNLAAVPSIVFGLLGLAVFLNAFGMPRSAPIVGGLVLTLMTLPIIIIAARAALKAVPPSIREAALGVGASKVQATFHHVLPLAMPGILTGSILGMAHALGETAPLLMIGMVAFIADVPEGFTSSATVLPVELYMWASRPERAWEPRTALAIIILLLFMLAMNALAIWLRRRFERRW
jgi:phosphate transport system permease protein